MGKKNEFSSFLNFKHLFLLPSFRSPQNVIKKIIKETIIKFDLNLDKAHLHMQRLEHLGFINNFDNFTFFKLTNKAYYYKVGWEKEQLNTEESKENKNIELFYIFLYLNKQNV